MDRLITYTMCIGIPFNRETTRLHSDDRELEGAVVESTINHILNVLEREGFITMERIFRILKTKASPNCPHVIFTDLESWEMNEEEDGEKILMLWLSSDYELDPVAPTREKIIRMIKKTEEINPDQEGAENGNQELDEK